MSERHAFRTAPLEGLEGRVVLSSALGPLALATFSNGQPSDVAPPSLYPPPDTPAPRIEPWAVQIHQQNAARAGQDGADVVFLGDSITYYFGDTGRLDEGSLIWNAQIAPLHADNFGLKSDVTQNVLWQIHDGELAGKPKAVVLLIGTNNLGGYGQSPVDTALGIQAIVQQIRTTSPGTKVILMGIFPRGANPDDPLRAEIAQTNALIAKLGDGQNVTYLDIGTKLEDFDGTIPRSIMYDYLHLNVDGYQIWADALQGSLQSILGSPAGTTHAKASLAVSSPPAPTTTTPGADLAAATPPAQWYTEGLGTPTGGPHAAGAAKRKVDLLDVGPTTDPLSR